MEVTGEEERNATEKHVHFTYKCIPDISSLCQGDLIQITEDIKSILADIHPYFLKDRYKYFMVLTQSCDLVRRNGSKCKTPFIVLATVQTFSDFFDELLIVDRCAERVDKLLLMDAKKKDRAYQLLERIYNNTEPDYFFLYKDESLDFPESMIASLKVTIVLKSDLHYESCLKAKKMELSDEFKAKLGWLVGNIYSRVGTTDWESVMSSNDRKKMLNDELCAHCVIGQKSQIKQLKNELSNPKNNIKTIEEAANFVAKQPVESLYNKVILELEKIINSNNKIDNEVKTMLVNSIKSKHTLKSLLDHL